MPQTTQFQGARLIPNLVYHDADEAIIWLDRAFGFTVLLRAEGEGGRIDHAQLVRDEMMIMLSSVRDDEYGRHFETPKQKASAHKAHISSWKMSRALMSVP